MISQRSETIHNWRNNAIFWRESSEAVALKNVGALFFGQILQFNPMSKFPWNYLKSKVYDLKLNSTAELKNWIWGVSSQICEKIIENVVKRTRYFSLNISVIWIRPFSLFNRLLQRLRALPYFIKMKKSLHFLMKFDLLSEKTQIFFEFFYLNYNGINLRRMLD